MQLVDFLSTLVPPGTMVGAKLVHITGADGQPRTTFSHSISKLHNSFAQILTGYDATQHNAYFALASYKQGFHQGADGKKHLRVRTNVDSLKAFWFDIDYLDKKTGQAIYTDAGAAAKAIKAFTQACNMPAPSILVSTGNGMHVYWPLAEPVTLERWQRLADALKFAAKEKGLRFDPVRTADACSVLRPIETSNWKDAANPKPVKLLYSTSKVFAYDELEAALIPWVGAAKRYTNGAAAGSLNSELGGGMEFKGPPSSFEIIIKHCGVARMLAETHGKSASEPLWTAGLQLLKFCEDGELWVTPISDGHPGYTQNSQYVNTKWQQRKSNTAGPTLCSTFEIHETSICSKCPHRGFVKTPIQLGLAEVQVLDGLPIGWRVAPERKGVERLMVDPTAGTKEWVRQLRHVPANLRVTRSITTGRYDLSFDVEIPGSLPWSITLPGAALGNIRRLNEGLADLGVPLKERESKAFGDLMTTWLGTLQANRRVADVTEQLGWIVEKLNEGEKIVGFSAGGATFYSDGRVRNDITVAQGREFTPIAKHYEPKGNLEQWKHVASFLAEQNKTAFTATLAAAFGTPLLRFTGLAGGILSIVSTASGVGKSSALKCSQAVWGSPTHAVNAVDDTPKSVARKLGFLNNLPAYWDELRGRKTVDDFLTLAFQITQGKEKTRLDSSAQLREVATWETMLIVASNESIFEAMARHGGGSDAGLVRTFEIVVEPFSSDRNRAEVSLLFESLNSNFGHAGRVYAQYLATHTAEVESLVHERFKRIAQLGKMEAAERFWFAIVTIIIVGAELASKLDLVKIDVRELGKFLLGNINRLRGRSVEAMTLSEPAEILASFMAAYQDRGLVVDKFPAQKANLKTYLPDMSGGMPKSDKISYHVARDQGLLRIPKTELQRWLEYRQLPVYNTVKRFRDGCGMRELRGKLGVGTKWELPQQMLLEFDLTALGLSADSATAGTAIPDLTDVPEEKPSEQL